MSNKSSVNTRKCPLNLAKTKNMQKNGAFSTAPPG